MSEQPTSFRPFARMGWGGRAASHFRGKSVGFPPVGTVVYRSTGARANHRLAGVTRDSTGAILAGCKVQLLTTSRNKAVFETTSAADGSFAFDNPGTGPFYIVAYKAGSGDVAGTTVNTLVAEQLVYAEPQ